MGSIITFYSYKGGTGRSMSLANVAWILASRGKRVLMIDWDLEAPGLHRYFHPFLLDKELAGSEGVIDFVADYAAAAVTPPAEDEQLEPDWYKPYTNILRYATSLNWSSFEKPGSIDFVPAGRQCPSYATTVNYFNWQQFYERLGGGMFLEQARDAMREQYDYVLIDSRTGISDTSGICTIQLPDTVVLCFTLNIQSIEGAAAVAESIERSGKPIRLLPVPMRVEKAEKDKLDRRRAVAWKRFRPHLIRQLPEEQRKKPDEIEEYLTKYWGEIEILYDPWYAYEEVLATFGDRPMLKDSMLASMEGLTARLTNREVTSAKPLTDKQREMVLAKYMPTGITGNEELDRTITEIESAYAKLKSTEREAAFRLLKRLIRVPETNEAARETRRSVPRHRLTDIPPKVIDTLIEGNVVRASTSGSETVIDLPTDTLIDAWTPLREELDRDRAFLQWRQKFNREAEYWWSTDRESGALLRGKLLSEAEAHAEARGGELNEIEKAFLGAAGRRKYIREWGFAAAAMIVLLLLIGSFVRTRGTDYQIDQIIDAAPRVEDDADAGTAHRAWVAALAKVGRDDEAVASIDRIPDRRRRAETIAYYATVAPEEERALAFNRATMLASSIPDVGERAMALYKVATEAGEANQKVASRTITMAGEAAMAFAGTAAAATDGDSLRRARVVEVLSTVGGGMARANIPADAVFDRAVREAQLASPSERGLLLIRIARELRRPPHTRSPRAMTIRRLALRSIPDIESPRVQAEALDDMVRLIDDAKQEEDYATFFSFLPDSGLRVNSLPAFSKAVDGLVDLGPTDVWDIVDSVASSIQVPSERCRALAHIARASHEAGQGQLSKSAFEQARQIAASLSPTSSIGAILELAETAHAIDDPALAAALFEQAYHRATRTSEADEMRGGAYAELAKAAAQIQSPDRAVELASQIRFTGLLDESGPEIAWRLGQRGFLNEALKVAELIPDAARRSMVLRDLVVALVGEPGDEDVDEAVKPASAEAINSAQQIAAKITDPAAHDHAVYAIAVQMIRTNADRGVRYARESLFRDEKRADLLLLAAKKAVRNGQDVARGFVTTASQYVARISDDRTKSRLLADMAIVLARLGDFDAGRSTAAQCAIQADRLRAYAGLLEATLTAAPQRTTKPVTPRPAARSA